MTQAEDTVLVVEDEAEARSSLMHLLELEGFRALGFPNGAEALEYLRAGEAPCLIIMDIRMPVMDGAQLRSVLLGDSRLAKIPVIVVTALDPSVASGLSVLRIFRKPVNVDALMWVIREHC